MPISIAIAVIVIFLVGFGCGVYYVKEGDKLQ